MTLALFYDTETTGIPKYGQPSTDPAQPRVTQLAAELCIEATGETIAELNHIILPCGWTIPDDIAKLTGLTTELALVQGVACDTVLPEFIELWKRASVRVAHNEQFDMRMVRIELVRSPTFRNQLEAGVPFADHWKAGAGFCTQGKSTKIVNEGRPAGDKKKTATLSEAYAHFTGKTLEGAHDAKVDVMACKAVYYGIKKHLAGVSA
jgi:DNA polymerase-3 subunit epsilon